MHALPQKSPAKSSSCDTGSGNPDLSSAQAINDWLAQANERLATVFSDRLTEDEQSKDAEQVTVEATSAQTNACKEKSRPVSGLSDTGTTFYAPTVLLAGSTGPGTPVVHSQGTSGTASPVRSQRAADLRSPQQQDSAALELSHTEEATSVAGPRVVSPVGLVGSGKSPSESEHFSEDAFDDDEADASFNASALSADILSDHGASLTFDGPAPTDDHSAAAPVAIAGREEQLPVSPPSRKVEGAAGATNASISYDEDFEAADVDEEEGSLGASFGGA